MAALGTSWPKWALGFALLLTRYPATAAADPTGFNFHWLATASGTQDDRAEAVAVDAAGQIHLAGSFEGQTSFGPSPITALGAADAFLARLGPTGQWLWARRLASPAADTANAVAADAFGNTYVAGFSQGPLTAEASTFPHRGGADGFVASFTATGELRWLTVLGGSLDDRVNALACDADGGVLAAGHFESTATFGDHARTSRGAIDVFVARLNPDTGTVAWVVQAGGTSTDDAFALAADAHRIVVAGTVFGDVRFGDLTFTNPPNTQIFTAGLDLTGSFHWAQCGGSTGSADRATALALDPQGTATVAGYFAGPAMLGGLHLDMSGPRYLFTARYDAQGAVQSLHGFPGYEARGLAATPGGSTTLAGTFNGTNRYGTTELQCPWGEFDLLLLRQDADGQVSWARQAGGTNAEAARALATDARGGLLVAGHATTNSIFDTWEIGRAYREEIFVALLSPAPLLLESPANVVTNAGAPATFRVTAAGAHPLHYQWFRSPAELIPEATNAALTLDPAGPTNAGSYWVVVTNLHGAATSAPVSLAILNLAAPQVSILGVTNTAFTFTNLPSVTVTLTCATPQSRIFYTLDGSSPGFTSTEYAQPFTVSSSVTLRAIAYDALLTSASTGPVPITLTLSPPTVRINGSTGDAFVFTNVSSFTLTLEAALPAAALFYTTEDTPPTTNAIPYTGPVELTQSATLRALAFFEPLGTAASPPIRVRLERTHTLTLQPNPDGTLFASPADGVYPAGATVQLSAQSAPGWAFIRWTGDASGANPATSVTLDGDRTVGALFGTRLTTATNGHGRVTVTPSETFYPRGTTLQVTAVPADRHFFTSWFGALAGSNNPAAFTVAGPTPLVAAAFSAIPADAYQVRLSSNGLGLARATPDAPFYTNNQEILLAAEAEPGGMFLKWTGSVASRDPRLLLRVNRDLQLTANFSGGSFVSLEEPRPSAERTWTFTLLGTPGTVAQLEASTGSLPSFLWAEDQRVTNVTGTQQVILPLPADTPMRLFRARLHP